MLHQTLDKVIKEVCPLIIKPKSYLTQIKNEKEKLSNEVHIFRAMHMI